MNADSYEHVVGFAETTSWYRRNRAVVQKALEKRLTELAAEAIRDEILAAYQKCEEAENTLYTLLLKHNLLEENTKDP